MKKLQAEIWTIIRSKLVVNTGYIWGMYLAGSLFGFLFWTISSRFYPTEQIGLASSIISISQLLVAIASLGIGTGVVQFFKGTREHYDLLNTALVFTGLMAVPAALIFAAGTKLWSPALGDLRQALPLLNFVALLVASNINGIVQMAFLSILQSKFAFWQLLMLQTLRVVFLIVFKFLGEQGIVFSLTLATCLADAVGLVLLTRALVAYRPELKCSFGALRTLIPYSISNGVGDMLYRLPALVLPVLVLGILGPVLSAYAYIAWMLLSALQAPGWALAQTVFAQGAANPALLKATIGKGVLYSLVLSAGMAVLILVAGPAVLGFFGADYRTGAAGLLAWFALGIPFSTVNSILFSAFRVRKQLFALVTINLLSAAIFLGLAELFLGSRGLAVLGSGWCLSQVVVLGLSVWVYQRPGPRASSQETPGVPANP